MCSARLRTLILYAAASLEAADAAPALCDFDLSRSANLSSQTTTRIGTPLYVPPSASEQLRPTFKSDIFSLGVTLFDALLAQPQALHDKHSRC